MQPNIVHSFASVFRRLKLRLFHPRSKALLAFSDGEIRGQRRQRLVGHLDRCFVCRDKLKHIASATKQFQELYDDRKKNGGDVTSDAGRRRLQAAIGVYNLVNRPHVFSSGTESHIAQTAFGRALAAELRIYLGAHMAAGVVAKIRHEQPQSHEVMLAIQPALDAFLGRNAGAAVAAKILRLFDLQGAFAARTAALPIGK